MEQENKNNILENIDNILEIKSSPTNNTKPKENNVLVSVLQLFAVIFLGAGIILPIIIISGMNERLIDQNPAVLILPLYLGVLLITFAGLSYLITEILLRPSLKTLWLENIVTALGVIVIIIGVIGFFMIISETNGSFYELQVIGVKGGIFILLINIQIGLLCLGTASIHNKYSVIGDNLKTPQSDSGIVFCPNCGNKIKLESGMEYCDKCGFKL